VAGDQKSNENSHERYIFPLSVLLDSDYFPPPTPTEGRSLLHPDPFQQFSKTRIRSKVIERIIVKREHVHGVVSITFLEQSERLILLAQLPRRGMSIAVD